MPNQTSLSSITDSSPKTKFKTLEPISNALLPSAEKFSGPSTAEQQPVAESKFLMAFGVPISFPGESCWYRGSKHEFR